MQSWATSPLLLHDIHLNLLSASTSAAHDTRFGIHHSFVTVVVDFSYTSARLLEALLQPAAWALFFFLSSITSILSSGISLCVSSRNSSIS